MKKKRTFTTVLILVTFVVALFLTLGSFVTHNAEVTPPPQTYQDWEKPIYNLGDKYYLNWPDVDTDVLSKSIVSYDGDLDSEKFEDLFIQEFEKDESIINLNDCDVEVNKVDDTVDIVIDSNLRMYDSKLIANPEHKYSYHLKVNE